MKKKWQMTRHVVERLWQKKLDQMRGNIAFRPQGSVVDLQLVNYPNHCVCVCVSSAIVQGTRGLMLSAALLGFIAILVEMVGMRCTTCLAEEPQQKDKVALVGGVIFLISGQSLFEFRHTTLVFGASRCFL